MEQRFQIKHAVILLSELGLIGPPSLDMLSATMTPIDGRPLLWHICDQLAKQGVNGITIYGDYSHSAMQEWIKTNPCGPLVTIRAVAVHKELDVLCRLRESSRELPERFFMIWGNKITSLRFDKLRAFHANHDKAITLLRGLESLGGGGEGLADKEIESSACQQSALQASTILGGLVVERDAFFSLTAACHSLSECINELRTHHQLEVLEHLDRYYFLYTPKDLELTRKFLKAKKILLIDRDGTINVKSQKGRYLTDPEDFQIIPESLAGLKKLSALGYSFIVVTNQAGLATGELTDRNLALIHEKMTQTLSDSGVEIHGIYVSRAHRQDVNDPDRKPRAGLFRKLSADFCLRLDDTFYIGDDVKDVQAAWNANCRAAFLGGDVDLVGIPSAQLPACTAATLDELADKLIALIKSDLAIL